MSDNTGPDITPHHAQCRACKRMIPFEDMFSHMLRCFA